MTQFSSAASCDVVLVSSQQGVPFAGELHSVQDWDNRTWRTSPSTTRSGQGGVARRAGQAQEG
jgi:hypothetical protein